MNARWAIVAGALLGAGLAWWLSREPADVVQARQRRAEQAAAATARDAIPSLYRWRDASGVLHVSDQPPKGRKYERIDARAPSGIEVHGDRD
ncbi:DUF4124 domain-containing protein [Cognatiluteimonas telluris]|uniref:DUF4124 domain-containing protein n=1 Tax=Cognatiluteimonas telluris TaxID=1104775 RepID=UPI001408455C|nr:DUF4124 domain-containing protein [Lysobacter telluris]